MRIELVIDELVLHGFEPAQRHGVADAMQLELARLLTVQPDAFRDATSLEMSHVSGASVSVDAGARPAQIGAGVARSLAATIHAHASSRTGNGGV
jgi:hypothetical protein